MFFDILLIFLIFSEEGVRFFKMVVFLGVWVEVIFLQIVWDFCEVFVCDGNFKLIKEELDRIGYCGKCGVFYQINLFVVYFELYIEQGFIFEDEGLKIGVVEGMFLLSFWVMIFV